MKLSVEYASRNAKENCKCRGRGYLKIISPSNEVYHRYCDCTYPKEPKKNAFAYAVTKNIDNNVTRTEYYPKIFKLNLKKRINDTEYEELEIFENKKVIKLDG